MRDEREKKTGPDANDGGAAHSFFLSSNKCVDRSRELISHHFAFLVRSTRGSKISIYSGQTTNNFQHKGLTSKSYAEFSCFSSYFFSLQALLHADNLDTGRANSKYKTNL